MQVLSQSPRATVSPRIQALREALYGDSGGAFFTGDGARTRPMWMTHAAGETFETMERWLRAWLGSP